MFALVCDRPRFARISGPDSARLAEELFRCPAGRGERGAICPVTPAPCDCVVARPFEDFASIAARVGLEEEALSSFNGGGAVWPGRKIWLPQR